MALPAGERGRPRVLMIGLDGAPPRLLQRLAAAGHMPHCARLMREGAFGVLRSTPNYNSFSAWCSFLTGVNPGKHGIFNFLNRVPGTYDLRRVHSSLRRTPSFLRRLSDAGKTVVSLNVPSTYPAEPLRGIAVADWMTPSVRSAGFTHPRELADEMRSALGRDYPLHTEVRRPALAGRYDQAFGCLRDSLRGRLAAAEYCLAALDWDAAAIVFTETDAANHYFGHFDPAHPEHDARLAERCGDLLTQAYAAADAAVGALLERADGDTTVIVLSDHGSCPESRGKAFTRGLLEAMGALTPRRRSNPAAAAGAAAARVGTWAFEALNRALPRGVKMRLDERFRGVSQRMLAGSFIADVDWSRTRAYCYYWDTDPYVNLQGREPEGVVEPRAYDAVREWLTEQLLAARDADSGRPAVKQVFRREQVYHGPCTESAPDLVVWWDDAGPIRRLRLGGREIAPSTTLWDVVTGGHHPEGTIVMWGRGVRRGAVEGASIMDVAPTALHLLGEPVPDYMDGRVLAHALAEGFTEVRERAASASPPPQAAADAYDEGERELVEERLRNLGYL